MKWTQSARWFVIVGLGTSGLFTACSDGDVANEGTSGSAGTESSAGQGNDKGGSSSSAGEGSDPTEAGMSAGGSAGSAGSAGSGPGSNGGEASGGQPNTPSVAMCQEACAADEDCLDGFECQDARCVSTSQPMTCSSDDLCRAELSGWTTECNEASDCPAQICVDIGEEMGRCATEAGGLVACATLQQDEVDTKDIDGADVTVCGKARAECGANGACVERCSEDSCPANFACNADTGACECDNDKACANTPNASKCVAGQCVCANDGDCTVNANKCSDGVCGCGDASVCDQDGAHPSTSWVCE
jgi:hypothetical protein